MLQLTAPQATVIVAGIGLIGAFVGWLGRGLTFVIKRWWAGTPRQDHATYLNSVADLGTKLRANGMTMEDVRQLEEIMRAPSVVASAGANEVVESMSTIEVEPAAFQTNIGMQIRTRAAHDVADANLEQAMADLRLLMRDREIELLEIAQERWRAYREALVECAYYEWEGGTHAPLAAGLAGLSETERRTAEVRAEVDERAAR